MNKVIGVQRLFMTRLIFLIFLAFTVVVSAAPPDKSNHSEQNSQQIQNDYLLGAGDTVRITVYGNVDLNTEARITKQGRISFPLLGDVNVGGLTSAEAESRIAEGLQKGGFVKEPHVNLIVTQYYSQFVAVLGNVYKPGRYSLDRATTLSDALALAGGPNQSGSDIVTLTRTNQGVTKKHQYDIQRLLAGDEKSDNPTIYGGDIIYVPKAPVFYIYGEVQRPGSFKLERDMTVAQALSTGGGLTARGTVRGIEIKRETKGGVLETLDAELSDKLQENDVVVIGESWF